MADKELITKACEKWLKSHDKTDCLPLSYEAVQELLSALKEQEAVKPQDAEMLIIHNGGAEEYVKDIESIVLLARKDYDIVYCGTFGRSVKWNEP